MVAAIAAIGGIVVLWLAYSGLRAYIGYRRYLR